MFGWWHRLALSLAVAALPAHAEAYRTFADDPDVGVAAVHPTRTIRWDIAFADIDTGDLLAIETAANAAASTWSAPACTDVRGSFRGSRSGRAELGDGLNTIEIVGSGWGDRGFDENRGAITEVHLVDTGDGWQIAEADVYVDFESHRWTIEGPSAGSLDLQAVLTHEWGHLLGFDHPHEGDPGATSSAMFPTYVGVEQRTLSADDIAGVCALYARAIVPCEPACAMGETCIDGSCIPDCPGGDCTPCEGRECHVMCVTDADCPMPSVCGVVGADQGWCQAPGSFGAPCATGTDCRSELCLVSMRSGEFCTQACRNDLDCPSGIPCQTVDGEDVCAPVLRSSSCSATRTRTPSVPLFCFLCLAVLLRRRRVR